MLDFPIDVVIPWVDGSDSEWLARKRTAKIQLGESIMGDSSDARYRDWGLLRYLFRGIEKNVPWVNRIFLVTDHQIPEWLNLNNEKLQVVFHDEYIPQKYLPTFSANTIELNLHRIQNLNEHFIYMNDDMFFMNQLSPTDFFSKNGLPKTSAIVSPWKVTIGDYFLMPLIDAAVISRNFDFRKTVFHNLGKWFNLKYGINVFRTLFSLPYPYFVGFMEDHLPNAFLKSTFEEVWNKEYEVLDRTCMHRFREYTDVNQYLFREWQVASGNFKPASLGRGYAFQLRSNWREELGRFDHFIKRGKGKLVCINDTAEIDDIDSAIYHTRAVFERYLPLKSSFEKEMK